jgi:hypothetical protein
MTKHEAAMNEAQYEEWVKRARALTRERMDGSKTEFGLGEHKRYQLDLPTATIRFYDDQDAERVCADIQFAGSWSQDSESWMWGWENESVPEAAVDRMVEVFDMGVRSGVEKLQHMFGSCDEGEAWSMASLACEILDAESVYRAPGKKNMLFLLLMNIRTVP